MTIRQKLEIIKISLGMTQTKLAERLGVSFPAFNGWWNEKSVPRPSALTAIDDLYLEVIGEKIVPVERLEAKKKTLARSSSDHKSVIAEILRNPDIRDEMILKLTYHSNSIEGSTLTEPDTAAILFDDQALPEKTMVEHLEAKNHQTALLHLFSHLDGKEAVDEDLVLRLHGILMNGIRPDAGRYRRHGVRIVGANVPTANYLKVPLLMEGLAKDFTARRRDAIGHAASVHARFEQIHPFSDGNGRVGRLLLHAMLIRRNLPPAVILPERKHPYYSSLNTAQRNGDSSLLQDSLCDAVREGWNIIERK